MSEVLWRRWTDNAARHPERDAIIHWCALGPSRRWRWSELIKEAECAGNYLKSKGVKQGDVCALIVPHHSHFYPLYMGIVAVGALPAVLAYPNTRLHPDKFVDGLVGMTRRSWLVAKFLVGR